MLVMELTRRGLSVLALLEATVTLLHQGSVEVSWVVVLVVGVVFMCL